MYEESVGIVETKYFNIDGPVELDSGETLNEQTSYNPPQPRMYKTPSPVKVDKLEYRWGF